MKVLISSLAGIGYTLATGRLFCDVSEFHEWAETLLGRPILTHEFGDDGLWDEMRTTFEERVIAERKGSAL